jgi:ornithine cyclodeaminase
MLNLNAAQVEAALDYEILIPGLEKGFQSEISVPRRHHHDYPNPPGERDSSLLLMPAWSEGGSVGVKIVNVTPQNAELGIPSIHGIYLYFDGNTGQPLALMDSNMITKKRTAAASALASRFLSSEQSSSLLVVGTGALAPELIKAHCTVRDISTVYIWGRNNDKARKVAEQFEHFNAEVRTTENLEQAVRDSDIISVATLSREPLIKGKWLSPGKHVDLVGSYRPDMREADDEVIRRSSVFIDTFQGAPYESGDLVIPIQEGIISLDEIKADLFHLCRSERNGRQDNQEITTFKSVGHALEDLVAARLVYEKYGKDHS